MLKYKKILMSDVLEKGTLKMSTQVIKARKLLDKIAVLTIMADNLEYICPGLTDEQYTELTDRLSDMTITCAKKIKYLACGNTDLSEKDIELITDASRRE